jgi:hypothetical protein
MQDDPGTDESRVLDQQLGLSCFLGQGKEKKHQEWDVLAEIRIAMQQLGDSQPN